MIDEMGRVAALVAARFRLGKDSVNAAITLLKQGESIPFMMRYRKLEMQGMKTAALRQLLRQLDVDAHRIRREEKKLEHSAKQPVQATSQKPYDALMCKINDDGSMLEHFIDKMMEDGVISSKVLPVKKTKKKQPSALRWADYAYDKMPIQRISARKLHYLFRGRREQALSLQLAFKDSSYGEAYLASQFKDESEAVIKQCWQKKCLPQLEVDVFARLRTRSDDEMIYGIEKQLQGLLLTPKASSDVVMGLYAENRTNLGVAVIDSTGEVLDASTLFPGAQDFRWHDAITVLAKYVARYHVRLIGIGNGQHWHHVKRLLAGFSARYPDMPMASIAVDEAGLLRGIRARSGAISIARRLQNPLLELLQNPVEKMHFGEVQDEVNPKRLAWALTGVIEDTVNRIGVDVNTAPVALLRYVSGFDETLAKALVTFREAHGVFKTREALKQVPGIDATCFLQSAGFLRILKGDNALDATRLHPKDYAELNHLATYSPDARRQLEGMRAPWRDPRALFKLPKFDARVNNLRDLKADMILEGVVHRVLSFGAFVDIGIQQLGLLHISALAERFVRDPHELLHVGDVIRVSVLQVDVNNQKIAFGMKSEEKPRASLEMSKKTRKNEKPREKIREKAREKTPVAPVIRNTAMADALAKLKRG